ncbi:hypothetical protein V8G54_031965 [Vigna mungo]|uniref:Beta-amyrin synthase n=1 Tax=Vigna mungo TaxID=3915 RepID=A0AAQ3RHE9_VIGMU
MWRVKIGDGGKDPHIFSTNNFLGRQIWEFDPLGGDPEERAQVEESRQHFFHNRYKLKACGDRLWRFQMQRENNFKQRISSVKIGEDETLRRASHYIASLQTIHGHWPAHTGGPLFYTRPFVSSTYYTIIYKMYIIIIIILG